MTTATKPRITEVGQVAMDRLKLFKGYMLNICIFDNAIKSLKTTIYKLDDVTDFRSITVDGNKVIPFISDTRAVLMITIILDNTEVLYRNEVLAPTMLPAGDTDRIMSIGEMSRAMILGVYGFRRLIFGLDVADKLQKEDEILRKNSE